MNKIFILFVFLVNAAFVPDQPLPKAAQEARAQGIIAQLKCFVCEGQPLNQSHVRLAQDLRRLIRGLIQQGKSDEEVIAFIAARYGEEVLLRPPLRANTIFLWAAPFAFLLLLAFLFKRLFFKAEA